MDDYRKADIDSRIKQMDIAIEAFLVMAQNPFFDGNSIRDAAERIRQIREEAINAGPDHKAQ